MAFSNKMFFFFFFSFFVMKYCYNVAGAALPLFISYKLMNKEFTGKSSLTFFFLSRKQWKKCLGWCTIFQELKSVAKAKVAQNNLQVAEGEITAKPGQDSIHVDYMKSESVCRFCNLYPESNNLLHSSHRWIFDCNFLVYDEMENISMNKISI